MSQSLPVLPAIVKEAAYPFSATEPPISSGHKRRLSLPKVKSDSVVVTFGKTNDKQFQDFLDRQKNSSQDVRLEIAKYQRDKLAQMRAESASNQFTGAGHFKMMLHHRFGTITAAWRQLLDPTSLGKLSFVDFCQCCRDMGYQRRMKQLWSELDTSGKGWITLYELDPQGAKLLSDFRNCCRLNYGEMLTAWRAFDIDKNHRLDEHELVKRCADMGFTGNVHKLFDLLKIDIGRKYLTIQDFDPKSMQCLHRGDDKMMTVKQSSMIHDSLRAKDGDNPAMRTTMPAIGSHRAADNKLATCDEEFPMPAEPVMKRDDSTVNMRWITETSKKQIRDRAAFKKQQEGLDKGMHSAADLKRTLAARFGSIYTGWRAALDMDGNGRLSFGEFCMALRNLGYAGNVKECFHALDRDMDGFITLHDIDHRVAEEIRTYQELALSKFPNMLEAWRSLDSSQSGHVDEPTFARHCKELNWSGNARSLFHNLKEDKSRRFLTLRDYDCRAWSALSRGDPEMISEEKGSTKQVVNMSFHERQGSCFSQKWARSQAKQDREGLEQMHKSYKSKDKGAHNADTLRAVLVRKYHTMTAAWKHGLDVYGNGRLPFGEFCSAMRRIGFSGDIHKTFKELDADEKGAITLRDLDEDSHQVVAEFREMLIDKYGSYIKAWQAMDINKNGCIEADEIEASCATIGYSKDPVKLFKLLLDGPGKRNITMADLDPEAMKAYFRGDLEGLSRIEKARASLQAKAQADQEAKDKLMEAKDWPSLKRAFIRKFGTITSAWRNILDINATGKVGFTEFSKRVRDFGFCGDIRTFFRGLDDDDSGIITFNEVDPNWYRNISRFNELLLTKYGSYEGAWNALDKNKNNVVELEEFAETCEIIGYSGDSKALFRQLLKNPLRKLLSPEDFTTLALIVQSNKADAASSMKMNMKADSHLSHDEKAAQALRERQALAKKVKSMQVGAGDWPQMKKQLAAKYGTIVAAWRHGLDVSGDGALSRTEFCAACRNNGFQGNVQEAFQYLDHDSSGVVTFNEVDPGWFAKLTTFVELMFKKYNNFKNAWEVLDSNKNNMLEIEEFQQVCADIGYEDDVKALFKQLLINQGRRFLTLEDLDVASITVARASSKKVIH